MRIGERVHNLLEETGKKQKDLAEFLGTGASTVHGWKLGNRNPSSEMLLPICEFFEISLEYLLTGKEVEKTGTSSLSKEDAEWLDLIHKLPYDAQAEFRAEMKGYLKAYYKTISEAYNIKQAK